MRNGDSAYAGPSSEDILRALALRRARSDSESSGGSAFSGAGSAFGNGGGRRGSACRHAAMNAAFARRAPPPQRPQPPERQGLVRRAVGTGVALFSLALLPVYLIAMVILQRFWWAAR